MGEGGGPLSDAVKHSVKITTFSRCSSSSSGFISPHSSSSPIFPGSQLEDVVPPTIPRGYNSYHPMSPPTNTGTQAKMAERRRESTVRKANSHFQSFVSKIEFMLHSPLPPSPLPARSYAGPAAPSRTPFWAAQTGLPRTAQQTGSQAGRADVPMMPSSASCACCSSAGSAGASCPWCHGVPRW
jgi:hypothetical protein